MTTLSTAALVIAVVLAVGDWIAVGRGWRRREYWCKPGATLALVVAAATLNPTYSDVRTLVVIALIASLAGDIFLMLPRDRFVAGLGSFLLAQVLYAVAFSLPGSSGRAYLIAAAVVVAAALPAGLRVVNALAKANHSELIAPVMVYFVAISAMVISALASGNILAGVGAVTFLISDSLIAEDRFVKSRLVQNPAATRVAIMVTYYLAQIAIVLSLLFGN